MNIFASLLKRYIILQPQEAMEKEDRSAQINEPLTNSLSQGQNFSPVNYNYPGSATANVANSIRTNKEYLQRMRGEYAMILEKLTENP